MKLVKSIVTIAIMCIAFYSQIHVHADTMVEPTANDIEVLGHCVTSTTSRWIIKNHSDAPIVVEYQLNDSATTSIELEGNSQELVELPLYSNEDVLHVQYYTFSMDTKVATTNCSPRLNNKGR